MLNNDIIYILVFAVIFPITAVIIEYLSLKNILNRSGYPYSANILFAVSTAFASLLISHVLILRAFAFCWAIFTASVFNFSLFESEKRNSPIVFSSFAFLLLSLLFPVSKTEIFLSLSIPVLAGSFSELVNEKTESGKYRILKDEKSFAGSFAFFFFAAVLLGTAQVSGFTTWSSTPVYGVSTVLFISLILSVVYNMTSNGYGNLFIPLFTALFTAQLLSADNWELLLSYAAGFSLSFVIAFLSFKAKFLSLSGSIATFLLAGFIFGLGGVQWSVPIMTFFILSSLLSKFRKRKNREVDLYFEKTGVRDHWQVAANGGIGGVLVILNYFFPGQQWFVLYLASLAAVCADTWATEIGTLKPTATYSILNFKRVEQGISGGISLLGTLGALCGAFVIALSGIYWNENNNIYVLLFVTLSGVSGAFFDSLLGATIQSQNRCVVCRRVTEREHHCGVKTEHSRGVKSFNNDLVNLSAAIFGIFIVYIFYGLYG